MGGRRARHTALLDEEGAKAVAARLLATVAGAEQEAGGGEVEAGGGAAVQLEAEVGRRGPGWFRGKEWGGAGFSGSQFSG